MKFFCENGVCEGVDLGIKIFFYKMKWRYFLKEIILKFRCYGVWKVFVYFCIYCKSKIN